MENLPRIFPQNLGAKISLNAIKTPPIFDLLSRYVEKEEMYRTFNMGVGMILAVDKNKADDVLHLAKSLNAYVIGEVCEGSGVKLI